MSREECKKIARCYVRIISEDRGINVWCEDDYDVEKAINGDLLKDGICIEWGYVS